MPKPKKTTLVYFIKERAKFMAEAKTATPQRKRVIDLEIASINNAIAKLDEKQK
jgi:hypothetical protein